MADFITGADIGMLGELEANGVAFFDAGQRRELLPLLTESGFNTIRLRLWVDPYDASTGQPYLGGTNDLPTIIALARRARDAGFGLILDLHYSDFWADPKKQSKPKAWADLVGRDLEQKVYDYTRDVLEEFVAAGIPLDYVQVGNEITNGMLWPEGRTTQFIWEDQRFEDRDPADHAESFDRLAGLLRNGVQALRDVMPDARVILHLDNGGSNLLYRVWFDEIVARDVPFDVIGLSYYPFWHGTLADLEGNLQDLAVRFGKDLLVVETGYAFRMDGPPDNHVVFGEDSPVLEGIAVTPEGQREFLLALRDVLRRIPQGRGLGIVYWEPEWVPLEGVSWASTAGMEYGDDVGAGGNPWANLVLFDFDGNALPGLSAFREM